MLPDMEERRAAAMGRQEKGRRGREEKGGGEAPWEVLLFHLERKKQVRGRLREKGGRGGSAPGFSLGGFGAAKWGPYFTDSEKK